MPEPALRVLILGDLHYYTAADRFDRPASQAPRRYGCEMIHRVVYDARRRGGFDLILQTGDLIDLPGEMTFQAAPCPEAQEALADVRRVLQTVAPDVPFLTVPGNHDGPPEAMLDAFGLRGTLHEIGGYRFLTFNDYAPSSARTRTTEALDLIDRVGREEGGPIVALQHNPVVPFIPEIGEQYLVQNWREVQAAYARAGVLLSISGHAHCGHDVIVEDSVRYFTAPGMLAPPRSYTLATFRGRDVTLKTVRLDMANSDPPVVDCHAHSEFAYCGKDISAAAVIDRSREMGLRGVIFTEHVPQLYCRAEDFWNARHIFEPVLWRREEHSRMSAFRGAMDPLRGEFVRAGFEVELDVDGQLTLTDEDRQWADLLAGTVHWLPVHEQGLSDSEIIRVFMETTTALCESGIDTLAHPWRYFHRAQRRTPTELYAEMADLLAATGVAVEINYHTNDPDPAFFAECIARGVKIALASDGHHLHESGAFRLHLDCLRQAAGSTADLADLLLIW